ncbi:MAG: response regulator [Campylobacterales bacterium]|nr:response regulator [Campylobacterales bacterium]
MSLFSKFFNAKKESAVEFEYFDDSFYEEIVQNSASMMLYFVKGIGFVGANKTFLETMGFANIESYNKKYESIRELFFSESEEIFTESDKSWMDYIKKYKPNGYRLSMQKRNEELIVADAFCHTFSKNSDYYVLEFQDVTALEKAKSQIKEVEQLKTKFLANIGHEFRTPMNGILGFVELLAKSELSAQQREYLSMISNSSKNLMVNIERLLELSQLQGGRLRVESEKFNLLPQMERLAREFTLQGKNKGVKVLSFIDPKLPSEIVGDAKKITQVMYALTQNAVKFTPRGGKVIVEVKLLKRQQNGDCSIGFGVKDTGEGISEEQIALINEPFTAGSQADERLGVGLTLSHGLVNLLGSELRIHTQKGEGSYVNFVLNFKASQGQNYKMMPKKKVKILLLDPAKIDEANFLTTYLRAFACDVLKSNQLDEHVYDDIDALYIVAKQDDSSWMLELGTYSKKAPIVLMLDEEEKLQTRLTHIVDTSVQKPLLASSMAEHLYNFYLPQEVAARDEKPLIKEQASVLVVEDNAINLRLIQIMLQEHEINVSTASNGVEAVDMCAKNRYDIIFMDIDLPQKNGIVATKEIKNTLPSNFKTPIIALTAMAMEGDREMLLREGLDDYIAKPLTNIKLLETLEKYLKVKA